MFSRLGPPPPPDTCCPTCDHWYRSWVHDQCPRCETKIQGHDIHGVWIDEAPDLPSTEREQE